MTGYVRGNLKTYRIVGSRTQANQCAVNFWMKGYWVEVYDKETGELLAGPLNPDEALPSYIV